MALTSAQQASIRMYLGYSDGSRQSPSNYRLEGVWAGLSADANALIVSILASLATVDASLVTVSGSTRAGIIQVEEIKWGSGMSAIQAVNAQGLMYVGRLAIILGVPVIMSPYGGGGAQSGPAGLG